MKKGIRGELQQVGGHQATPEDGCKEPKNYLLSGPCKAQPGRVLLFKKTRCSNGDGLYADTACTRKYAMGAVGWHKPLAGVTEGREGSLKGVRD